MAVNTPGRSGSRNGWGCTLHLHPPPKNSFTHAKIILDFQHPKPYIMVTVIMTTPLITEKDTIMKKIIATLALLAATTAPAFADNCVALNFQMNSLNNMIASETTNLNSYAAMMNSSMSVGDVNQAVLYAGMGKDSLIRQKGNVAAVFSVMEQVKAAPGMCGVTQTQYNELENGTKMMDDALDSALVQYKQLVKN